MKNRELRLWLSLFVPISAEEHATFLTIQGWQAYAHGCNEEALAKLSEAADEQDRVGQAEVDIPAREMYADMLYSLDRPKDALTQYKNRFAPQSKQVQRGGGCCSCCR